MDLDHLKQAGDLKGDIIKEIFTHAEELADMHATLTSPRGDYFKKSLLARLANPVGEADVEVFAKEVGVSEYKRHIHRLRKFGLIEQTSDSAGYYVYRRTYNGEEAMNALNMLEGKFGPERIVKLYEASLGKNSIRLFLKVYGSPKEAKGEDIVYTPLEIGQISSFLPRTIEGIAAIDKLDDAGLVSYLEDGNVHVNPRRATVFYAYLKNLYLLIAEKLHSDE